LREEGLLPRSGFLNFIYLNEKDEIIAISLSCDFSQYIHKKSQVFIPQFDTIRKHGHVFSENTYSKDIVPGRNIYTFLGTIK